MSSDRLTPLQRRVLALLSTPSPRWTLTGGAALAGFHTRARGTRDLDLFFRNLSQLGGYPADIAERLATEGLEVTVRQTSPTFHRLSVSDGTDSTVVDLVAEPGQPIEPALQLASGDAWIPVETRHEILTRKLCALLSRSEPRDLGDIRALLETGADLERAVADAPRRDGGFSTVTLAWVLRSFDSRGIALALGWTEPEAAGLDDFRNELIERLAALGAPE